VFKNYKKIQKNFIRIDKFLSSHNVTALLREKTKEIYNKLAEKMNMQGRNLNHIFIGIYYYACRQLNMAKTIKEIALQFNVTERIIKKAFNSIKKDIVEPTKKDDNNEIIETEKNYVRTFIEANINAYEIKMIAFEIITNINKNQVLKRKSPETISGLALLLAYELSNDNSYDKKEFYDFFSKKNTLKKAYEEIKDNLQIIVPQKLWDKINNLNVF
jgi:transcription initiation factor TFIIIB Brf1 subunit/transcription initiation factor TFIIB